MLVEDYIRDFFRCSLKNDFSEFDFDGAFEEYLPYLHQNNVSHGLCDFSEFLDYYYDMFDDGSDMAPESLCWGYIGVDQYELFEAMVRHLYDRGRRYFESDGMHSELFDLENAIDNRGKLSEPELITLFDRAIHAEHCNGMILDGCDPNDLREEVENERKQFATAIRDFL